MVGGNPQYVALSQSDILRPGARVYVNGGRWAGRSGCVAGTEDTRPLSNGGLVVVVDLDAGLRAAPRTVRVRLGSLQHEEMRFS